jgi:hypothetical protein
MKAVFLRQTFFDTARRKNINLLYAGKDFSFETLEETRNFLLELEKIGYHIPKDAIESMDEEIKEASFRRNFYIELAKSKALPLYLLYNKDKFTRDFKILNMEE